MFQTTNQLLRFLDMFFGCFLFMHLSKVSWGLDGVVCDTLFLRDSQRLDVLGLSIGSGQ